MAYQGRQKTQGNGKFGPLKGKGIMVFLNEDTQSFVQAALADVSECYDDATHEKNPSEVLTRLLKMNGDRNVPDDFTQYGTIKWHEEKDDFGHKVYCKTSYAVNGHEAGELRFTVVLVSRTNDLNMDLRIWGPYTFGN